MDNPDENVFIVVGTLTSPAGSGPSSADHKHHIPAGLHTSGATIVAQREMIQSEESHNAAGQSIQCVPLACIKQETDQGPVSVGTIYHNEYTTVLNANLGASGNTATTTNDSVNYPPSTAAQQHFQLPSFSTVIQRRLVEEESVDVKPVAEDLTAHRKETVVAENASVTTLRPERPSAVVAEDLTSGSSNRQGSSVVVMEGAVSTSSFCTSGVGGAVSGAVSGVGGARATSSVQLDEDDLHTQVAIQFLAQKVAQQSLTANAALQHQQQQQQQHPSASPLSPDPKSKRQKSPNAAYGVRSLSSSSTPLGGGSGSGGGKKRQRLALSLEEETSSLSAPPPAKRKQRSFTHTGVRTCVCEICHAVLSAPASLKTHMLIHSGDKPYPCGMCSAAFRHQSTLKRHMCIHTGEKKFTCQVCQSPFARKTELTQHQRSHSTVRPFICKFCGSSYKHPKDLSQHLRAHARNSSSSSGYTCSVCSISLSDADSLAEHMRTAHSANTPASSSSSSTSASSVFVCEVCEAKFTTLVALTQHVMKTHLPSVVAPPLPHGTAEVEVVSEGGGKAADEKNPSAIETQHHHCSICTLKFEDASQLMKHFKEAHWTEQLKASLSAKAGGKDGLKGSGEFCCKMCNTVLYSASALAQHIKKKHWFSPEESASPGSNKKRWQSADETPSSPCKEEDGGWGGEEGVKVEGESHICTSCGMEYPRLKSLAQHMKKSHSINLLPCTKCGHTFLKIREWLDHTDICS